MSEIFGNHSAGDGVEYAWPAYCLSNKGTAWTCPGTGKQDVLELAARFQNDGHARLAIYTTARALVMQAVENTADHSSMADYASTSFVDVNGDAIASPQLDGGTSYLLVLTLAAGSTANLAITAGAAGSGGYAAGDKTAGFAATLDALGDRSWVPCIWCTVEEAEAPPAGGKLLLRFLLE